MDKLKQIMVVEDEPDIREILSLALTEIGEYEITLCKSGQEAIDKLNKVLPQLILLDVMMPGLDGPMTLKKIQENPQLKNIPVIFMTARIQSHEMEEYIKLGTKGVISKPFDPITLPLEISKLWLEIQSGSQSNDLKNKTHQQLDKLFEEYANKLPSKIDELENMWEKVKDKPSGSEYWEDFYRLIHNLIGSSGTYGFKELNTALNQLSKIVKNNLNSPSQDEDYQIISKIVENIKSIISNDMLCDREVNTSLFQKHSKKKKN